MRRLFILLFICIASALPLVAQQTDQVAHGAEKEAHKTAHPTEDHGEGHHAPKTYFGIPAWILKLANMIIFLGLLGYLLGGPIRKTFAERKAQIKTDLAEARARREKADRLAADIDARLRQLETDVQSIIVRAREEGERQRTEMIAAAESEAAKVLATARNEVDARVKMARAELTALAGELATQRAAGLVAQSITDADRHRIFEDSLRQVEEMR